MRNQGSTLEVVIASGNKSKIREIGRILEPYNISIIPLKELSGLEDVEETGTTFTANAVLKATEIARLSGLTTIADDSGIEVDALSGAPGILSARFAGEKATDSEKNELILAKLKGVPWLKRSCGFRCVAALALPDGRSVTFSGSVRGYITQPEGSGGFGYDPIFFYPPYGTTFGCVSAEEKNAVSHRGRAFRLISQFLRIGFVS